MGILTGYWNLDRKLGEGLQEGSLYLIGARPSMGKTSLMLNMVDHICVHDNRSAVIVSLEMPASMLVGRMLALESGIDPSRIRTGRLDSADWTAISKGAAALADSNIIVLDKPGMGVDEIREECSNYKEDNKDLSVIFIDYLQLLSDSRKGSYISGSEEYYKVMASLKELAVELSVPIVVLSQLSRTVENREDHRPMLSDIRYLDSPMNSADCVLFLYRDEYYDWNTERKGIAEVIVNGRDGAYSGCVELKWFADKTRFENMPVGAA